MAKNKSVVLVACMVVLLNVHADGAITCREVQDYLIPCAPYFNGAGLCPASCCDGVRNLGNAAASSADDRRSVCRCLKSAAAHFPGDPDVGYVANDLLYRCNIKLPYKITVPTNCDKIH